MRCPRVDCASSPNSDVIIVTGNPRVLPPELVLHKRVLELSGSLRRLENSIHLPPQGAAIVGSISEKFRELQDLLNVPNLTACSDTFGASSSFRVARVQPSIAAVLQPSIISTRPRSGSTLSPWTKVSRKAKVMMFSPPYFSCPPPNRPFFVSD